MAQMAEKMPTSFDLVEEEPALEVELSIPPLLQIMKTSPFTWHLAGIPEVEEEVASVKDSVTSRLLAQGHGEDMDASGSSGHPVTPEFKFVGSFMARDGDAEEVKKTAFMPHKEEQKRKLSLDPMVETSWKSADFSALVEESILLVEESMGMLSITSGVSHPEMLGLVK